MPVRVVLAEDEFLVRAGIERLLDMDDAIEVVATYPAAAPLLANIATDRPDVVVTDLRMPPEWDGEGLELADELRRAGSDIGVVVLSQISSPAAAARIFADGAHRRAYLLKEHVSERAVIVHAISEVARGGSYVDPDVVVSLVAAHQRTSSPIDSLSLRERDVLALIAKGYSNEVIAGRLDLSKRSVEGHINAIFVKLGLPDERQISRRVAAVLLYLDAT